MSHPAGRAFRAFVFYVSSIRLIPHLILWRLSPRRDLIASDARRWAEAFLGPAGPQIPTVRVFLSLLTDMPEFRNLVYFRLGGISAPIKFLCRPMESLWIHCGTLGPGLVIQHGIATVIVAHQIGANCWVNQQVTIGSQGSKPGFPVLGDNVRVSVGAKVLGGITIGDNAVIGANAVVVKDVPPNVTVVGIPAYIVRRDGQRVNEPL